MNAKRFRLDSSGNLLADGLFCRVSAHDPRLTGHATRWASKHRLNVRAAKAQALVEFEALWAQGHRSQAMELAEDIHALMLAQRLTHERRKRLNNQASQK